MLKNQVEDDPKESRLQVAPDAEESRLQAKVDAEESRRQAELDAEESFISSILDESDVDEGTFDDDSDTSTSADEWNARDSDMESDVSSGDDVSPALTSTPRSKRLEARKLLESEEIPSPVNDSQEATQNRRSRRHAPVGDSQTATPSKLSCLQVKVSLKPEFK
ncbi:uncharacterized protein LOC120326065 [Styela clava]